MILKERKTHIHTHTWEEWERESKGESKGESGSEAKKQRFILNPPHSCEIFYFIFDIFQRSDVNSRAVELKERKQGTKW